MAELIEQKFHVVPKLIPGAGGVYDITRDGKLIYSKHQSGWFPENQDIIDALEKGES
ncbi:MAG: hypothetical protein CSA26_12505 [Desulfobacterales bacterium]|nr:MAG: hypothetical protein CSA26_12505 [Desulfobacterales bacterium]